jgi:Flp pilus assembly protein TadD
MQKAVADQPDDALALARLAELQLMQGELTKANENAAKASDIAPDLAHAQMVLGFSALTTTDIQTAKSAFTQAITLDSANPMSRLGLGLAKIREGALTEGRKDLEAAVALSSNNALLRSYLGKAYFEEKRGPLDDEQFDIAKQLDPNDPTAWLYSAIRAQTEGQPVEALEELQGSIERNDNRAVYRSRLLLDSDQATRSTSLARVYNDLGFEQLALSEGWKSVNTDPTNSSAHRLLADSYAALPRHEIARVSELLQAQLLQPLNATPLQPTLAESDQRLIRAGGPATASYNEFNALFNRNQNNFLLNVMGGDLDTSNGEAIVAGIHNKISYSLGVTKFETDGFRENNDQEDQIAVGFIQMDLSAQTSVQFEYRTRESEFGDYQLNFFEDNFDSTLRNDIETDTARIGLRHNLSPQDVLLVSIISQERDAEFTTTQPPVGPLGPITVEVSEPDNKGKGIEIQHLHRSSAFNLTTGVGYFDIDREQVSGISSDPGTCGFIDTFLNPPGPNCSASSTDTSAKHKNIYLYSTMPVSKNLALTLGASYDDFDTENTTSSESKDQFNPKLGVNWDIQPNTTLRAAAFKTLNRVMITQQTIEPTQVAGFNQFFDDVESTEAVRYGVALDHKFSIQMYGGIEYSERDLEVPIPVPGPGGVELTRLDWDEKLGRAYLFLTPADWVALSIEFQNEHFKRPNSGNLPPEVKTRKLPLGVRLFSDSGWNFAFTATYIDQEGDFLNPATGLFESGSSNFWVADASVSYQLPKRRGYVSIGATNLTDKQFSYQETDLLNSSLVPERMAFARLTLTLP